jgi:serine protease
MSQSMVNNGMPSTSDIFGNRNRRSWFMVVTAAAFLANSPLRAQDANGLLPRTTPEKPVETTVAPGDAPHQVILKFREGSYVRLRNERFVIEGDQSSGAAAEVDLSELEEVLSASRIPTDAIERLHTRPESELDSERKLAQRRSGRQLADLNLYYKISVPPGVDVGALCYQLNSLPFVELATTAPRPAPPPVDIPPSTPDLSGVQGYRDAPPGGIGALDPLVVLGGDGAATAVVDVEYSWGLDHEDLGLDLTANIDSLATPNDPFDDTNHGTAVLGELSAGANAYGVTGIVPAATLLVAPANTVEHGYNPARAITLATGVLIPGHAILIEQQTGVCGGICDQTQQGCGPLEWHQSVFDAIAAATALGIVVVEVAGNGNVNLDDPNCGGLFDRNVRDSGAIIVGAGDSATHARLGFSSFGSRVDVQGWGNNVTTTGYGDLFNPGDARQWYTGFFGGGSSASPIVTGAVLAIQGAVMGLGFVPIDPIELRQILVNTGTPQSGPGENIGPLPNIPRALAAIAGELAVAVDILPRQCANRVRIDQRGNLPVAILGAENFDVRDIDIGSVRLAGVPPQDSGSTFRDIASPFDSFVGKRDARDCTPEGPDGFEDLHLRFSNRATGAASDGEVVVVPLTAELDDGTPIRGEDVLVFIEPRKRAGPPHEAGLSPDLADDAAVNSGLDD